MTNEQGTAMDFTWDYHDDEYSHGHAVDDLGLIYEIQVKPHVSWSMEVIERTYTAAEGWDNNVIHAADGDSAFPFLAAVVAAQQFSQQCAEEEHRRMVELDAQTYWADR